MNNEKLTILSLVDKLEQSLKEKLPKVTTIGFDEYQEKVKTPAILMRISDMDDIETAGYADGTQAVKLGFEFLIFLPRAIKNVELQIRELARILMNLLKNPALINHSFVQRAENIQAFEGTFGGSGKNIYETMMVSCDIQASFGDSVWEIPDNEIKEVWASISPDVGVENIDKYKKIVEKKRDE